MIKKIAFILMFSISLISFAKGAERGFAVIVDKATYQSCKSEIDSYKALLQKEGLVVSILDRDWVNPKDIKNELLSLYKSSSLEGAVFIGNIPIVMIRDAQHMTSAFKMDQDRNPMNPSSVPSDRFYDDFDLKFDFISKDSLENRFYYSLRSDSPQKLNCDIYTGRIKQTKNGEEGYRQIRDYFKKLLEERGQKNKLDVICSYTGEGSFSNSLTAWKEEAVTLREQFPQAFYSKNSAKLLMFYMYPLMKETVIEELKRPEMDLMLFHEHGMPHRQYLTGEILGGAEENIELSKLAFRERLRREAKSPSNIKKLKEKWIETFKIDTTWFQGAFDPQVTKSDSLNELNRGIVLEDIPSINPNPRVVIFDACYNGDFREQSCIASEYIFAKGKTLVAIGNSVNVLQDKSATDLVGLMGLGYKVGQWAQITNILESHIIGDPTYYFESAKKATVDYYSNDVKYWLNVLNKEKHPDLQGLALHELFRLEYPNLSNLLKETYYKSPYYVLRLQCLHLLPFYNDNNYSEVLKTAIYDPYEFIRRKATYGMGRVGKDEFIPSLASIYLNDCLDERVCFNAVFSFDLMDFDKVKAEVKKQVVESESIFDKDKTLKIFMDKIESRERLAKSSLNLADVNIKMGERLFAVSSLRNNSYHQSVGKFLEVIKNPNENLNLKIKLAEALGWFTQSYRKSDIISVCKEVASNPTTDQMLKNELVKTINRLEIYMR